MTKNKTNKRHFGDSGRAAGQTGGAGSGGGEEGKTHDRVVCHSSSLS